MRKFDSDDDEEEEMYSACSEFPTYDDQFAKIVKGPKDAQIAYQTGRRKSISAERYDPEMDTDYQRVIHPKTDLQRKELGVAISKIVMFSSLDAEQMQYVVDAMFQKAVQPGDHIIDEGQDGDNFYVIERGKFDVFINDPKTKTPVKKGSYNGTGSFGELALMYNCPRLATIVATSEGTLWAMDRHTFRRIVVKNNAMKRNKFEKFLADVPLLSTLTFEERSKLADAMNTISFNSGQYILEQGGPADYLYFVMEGTVVIKKKPMPSRGGTDLELSRCEPGQYFGELALITNQPRAASAIADGPCTVAAVDVKAFERLMGPCKELMMRNIPLYEEQLSRLYNEMDLK